MSLPHGNTRRATPLVSVSSGIILVLLAAMWAGGCDTDSEVSGPEPEPGGPPTELLGSAIRLHVDLRGGKVTVTQPSVVEGTTEREGLKPSFALLGRNEIEAEVTEVSRSAVGQFAYNRVRVTLNLALRNKLLNSDLVPSTFPSPPVAEVVAFPFATQPAGLFGLKVRASPDWDIAPHNFFNDGLCLGLPTPPADCFRSEAFGATLQAGSSATRRIGFDVDPTVTTFMVYVVVAADIQERSVPEGTGGIAGAVRSMQVFPEIISQNVTVRAGDGGPTSAIRVDGLYVIDGLVPGPVVLSLEGLPAECSLPANMTAVVEPGQVTVFDIALLCDLGGLFGQIIGVISSSQGEEERPLPGLPVEVRRPGEDIAFRSGVTNQFGVYGLDRVPAEGVFRVPAVPFGSIGDFACSGVEIHYFLNTPTMKMAPQLACFR